MMQVTQHIDTADTGLAAPKPTEPVYLTSSGDPHRLRFTWVHEVLSYTLNGCFKVRDKQGKIRIVKRYQEKDRAESHAWIALN